MLYYKIPIKDGIFTFPEGCLLRSAYSQDGYMFCEFDSVTTLGDTWVQIDADEFNSGKPELPAPALPVTQEIIATSAALTNGNIVLELSDAVTNGTLIKFTAPCICKDVTDGIVIDGVIYSVVDSMGNVVTGIGDVWESGAQVAILLDTAEQRAFIQGAAPVITPISRGGTGASTAEEARDNLGITPENIGAIPTSGGTVNGNLTMNGYFIPVRGKNYGTEGEIPADLPDGALWLKVVG